MINSSGIYQILNTENGKKYVGSAKTFRTRWGTHRRQLTKGKHHSQYLQRAWDKYGPNVFEFQILLLCDPDNCIFFEQRAIDFYNAANYRSGYNVAPAAGGQLGFKHSVKSKRAMSVLRLGSKRTEEQKKTQSIAQRSRTDVQVYCFNGREQTMLQWADELGWNKDVLARRVRKMGVDEAFTRPNRMEDPGRRLVVNYLGETKTLVSIAKEHGLDYSVLKSRIARGWTVDAAVHTPLGVGFENRRSTRSHKRKTATTYEYTGKTMTITDWAKHLGMSRGTLAYRIGVMKWDIERALTEKPNKNGVGNGSN